MKLDIKYAYGRNIFPLEQQRLRYGEITLEDEIKLEDIGILKEARDTSL